MSDKLETEIPDHIKGLIKKSESVSFGGGRDFKDTPEIKNDLVNALDSWRNTLIPNADKEEGEANTIDNRLSVILPAQNEVSFVATRDTQSELLIPVIDGLRIQLAESDYTLKIEDHAKGGSKIVLHKSNNQEMRTAKFDLEAHKRSIAALEAGDQWEHAMASNKAVVNSTMDYIVLNREHDPLDQWRKIMRSGDGFRIDSIKGGLIKAQCWGTAKFSVAQTSG
jgi:hypothetical protein